MRRRRAFLIVIALLIMVILLLVGMGFLGSQVSRYNASLRYAEMSQARQLALAGLEDARIKLEMDQGFPPAPSVGQPYFSYSESFTLPTTPPVNATYTLILDRTYAPDPNNVILITSIGSVGPLEKPYAQYCLKAELDIRADTAARPAAAGGVNSDRLYRYTHIQDQGAP